MDGALCDVERQVPASSSSSSLLVQTAIAQREAGVHMHPVEHIEAPLHRMGLNGPPCRVGDTARKRVRLTVEVEQTGFFFHHTDRLAVCEGISRVDDSVIDRVVVVA